MITFNHIENMEKVCYGCGVCSLLCERNAIEMKKDEEGFLYPVINKKRCIKCRKCQIEKCITQISETYLKKQAYICKYKDLNIRMKSQSGGLFTAASDYILNEKGSVCASILNMCDKRAEHLLTNNFATRDKMRGSKYIESDLGNTFIEMRENLKLGNKVLFIGTPCQVVALKSFLGNENLNANLFVIDILCHGISSPNIFRDYISYLESIQKIEISDFIFRNKNLDDGWHGRPTETYFAKEEKYLGDKFAKIYYSHFVLRPSCYQCQFASDKRSGDLTIGDAWGIEKFNPEFDDNKGCSLLIINNEQGEKLFKKIQTNLDMCQIMLENYTQPNMTAPTQYPHLRKKFWEEYRKSGFEKAYEKYLGKKIINRVLRKILIIKDV